MLKKLLIFFFSFFTLSIVGGFLFTSSTEASTLWLSPGSANIPQGTVRSVSVGINTAGESVNGVSAYLSYPSDKLEVAWISYGSRFDIQAEKTFGGGSIRISAGSISGVVGNVTVATIGFRGKALGSGTVAFIGGSAAPRTSDSSDSLNLAASGGGVYTVIVPPPVTPTPTGQPGTELLISNVKVSDISTNSAVITWETNEKADSTVEYGLSPNRYILTIHDEILSATHEANLVREALIPGTTFHFRVKSKGDKGNEAVSKNYTFQLKGYDVTIKITDSAGKPVADTEVYLYSSPQKSKTNTNGEVRFVNVTPGKHLVVVKLASGIEKTGEVEVSDSPLSQNFVLSVDTTESKAFDGRIYMAILLIILVIAGSAYLIWKRRQNPPDEERPMHTQPQEPSVQQPSSTWQQSAV